MASGDYPQVDVGSSLQRLEAAVNRVLPPGETIAPIRTSQQAYDALKLYQQLDRTQRPTLGGNAIKELTGTTRFPTTREDNYTPTVEEVVTSRVNRRDQLKRVAETITAERIGTGTDGVATFQDLSSNTGISVDELKRISQEGKDADAALEEIRAVGLNDARIPDSIRVEASTPIQGGYLETLGMMEEFKDPAARTQLGYALKQMQMAEESGINQSKKDQFVDVGRTRMQGDVQTSRLTQQEQMDQDIKLGRESQVLPTVITPDGQRLLPGVRKDGNPRPVAQVPIARNEDGSVMNPYDAIALERRKIEGWKNMTPESREARIARFSAKQRNAAAFTPAEDPIFTGELSEIDLGNAGLQDAVRIQEEQDKAGISNSELDRQYRERGMRVAPENYAEDYEVPATVKANDSIKAQVKGRNDPSDPMIDAQFRQAQMLASQNPVQAGPSMDLAMDIDLGSNQLEEALNEDISRGPIRGDRRPLQGPSRPVVEFSSPITQESAARKAVYEASARKPESQLPEPMRPEGSSSPVDFVVDPDGVKVPLGRGYAGSSDVRGSVVRSNTMLEDPWATADPIARAQAPDVVTPNYNVEMPPALLPGAPVEARQAPVSRRPPEVTGGGDGRFFDERMGNYRDRGGDIYKEREARQQDRKGPANSRNRFSRRNLGIGAAATGGVALAGSGISGLINNEREAREEQR